MLFEERKKLLKNILTDKHADKIQEASTIPGPSGHAQAGIASKYDLDIVHISSIIIQNLPQPHLNLHLH